jgi:two-component system cell cycle sensor histidine kinase/response regulator CckA
VSPPPTISAAVPPPRSARAEPLRIVLLEGDRLLATAAETLLRGPAGEFSVTHADSLAGAIGAVHAQATDCVLLDLGLPDATDLSGLQELRRVAPAVAIVVLTACDDAALGVAAVQAGAQDFLVKGAIDGEALRRSIRYAVDRKRSEVIKAAIIDATPDSVITVDGDGRIVEFNAAAERTFGHRRDDIVGEDVIDLLAPPALREAARHALAVGFAGSALITRNQRIELSALRADGAEIPVEVTLVVTGLEPAVYTSFLRDLTDRRASEEATARLAAIAESSGEAILGSDLDGTLTSWNRAAERLYGYTREEALRRPARMLMEDPCEADALLAAVARGEHTEVIESRRRRRDGTFVDVAVSHSPVCDGAGRVVGAAAVARDITAKQEARAALRLSEWRYRTLVSQLPDAAVFQCDRDLRIILAEGALLAQVGWAADSVVGRRLSEFLPPSDPAIARCRSALTGEASSFEWTYGALVVDVDIVPMRDDAETIIGAMVLARDVTERKNAERSGRLQTELLDRLDVGVIATEPDGRITHWNRQATRYFGVGRDEALGRRVEEVYSERGIADPGPVIARLLAGETVQREYTVGHADGTSVAVLVNSGPVHDDGGNLVGLASIAVDVTATRRAAEELHRAHELFESAFDSAPIGMALVEAGAESGGSLIRVNEAICRMLGRQPDELLGRACVDVVHPDDAEQIHNAARRVLGDDSRLSAETRLLDATGGTVWIRLSASLVRDANGAPLHAIVLVEDLRAAREAHAEKAALEARLLKAQKLDSIGRLAGGIAHDFNNLLAVISNYASLVAEELPPGGPLHADLAEISEAAQRAEALTRQLLTFARREVVQTRSVDLNAIVSDTEKLLRRTIGEHVKVRTLLAPDLWPARGDQSQIEQVLLNLSINGRDAMPDGGMLTIATRNVELDEQCRAQPPGLQPGRYVRLLVSDTGTGMAADVIEHAFEPFFTTKPAGEGTGLGLATVYGIVTSAGGQVELKSRPGHGTGVAVWLPVSADPADAAPASPPATPPPGGGETVLVVEDEAPVRTLAARLLGEAGYRVLEAGSAVEALLLADVSAPDLILSDVVMPGMSGAELARQLGYVPPMLFMSGYTDDVVMRHGLRERRLAFVPKPFTRATLLQAVRDELDRSGRPDD